MVYINFLYFDTFSLQISFEQKLIKFIHFTTEQDLEFSLEINKDKIWRKQEEDQIEKCYTLILKQIIQQKYQNENINETVNLSEQQYLENLIVENRNQFNPKCGKCFQNEQCVRCSCMKSQLSCFCLDCFDTSIHQGPEHQYYIFKSNGICDCGQEIACDQKYWCKKHQNNKQKQNEILQSEKQDIINIKNSTSVFVFLTRLQLSFAHLLIFDKQYQQEFHFVTQLLLRVLKLKHIVLQQTYSKVILSNIDNTNLNKICTQFDIHQNCLDIVELGMYIQKIKQDSQQKLISRPIHTLLSLHLLVNDKQMYQYFSTDHVIEQNFRVFIRHQYYIYNQQIIKELIDPTCYIDDQNKDIFSDLDATIPIHLRIKNEPIKVQGCLIDTMLQVHDNQAAVPFTNAIGLTSDLIDAYIFQSIFSRQKGKRDDEARITGYRVNSVILEGLQQILNITRTQEESNLIQASCNYLERRLQLFKNVFFMFPRQSICFYTTTNQIHGFGQIMKYITQWPLFTTSLFTQIRNIYNTYNFLQVKLPQILYLSIVTIYNKINLQYRTEIIENDKVFYTYLANMSQYSKYNFNNLLTSIFEVACLDNPQNAKELQINICSNQVKPHLQNLFNNMLYYSILMMSQDILQQPQNDITKYIFTPYNLLLIHANKMLQIIQLQSNKKVAAYHLLYAITNYNSLPISFYEFYLCLVREAVTVLFTKSCFEAQMLRKYGEQGQLFLSYLFTLHQNFENPQKQALQFLSYLSHIQEQQVGLFIKYYYQYYGIDNSKLISNAVEQQHIDSNQAFKLQFDATKNMILCLLYDQIYQSPRDQLIHCIINLFIQKQNISANQIHKAFIHHPSYNYQVVDEIVRELTDQTPYQHSSTAVYNSTIVQPALQLSLQGISKINAYDADYYNKNLMYYVQQRLNAAQLDEFVNKHLQIAGNKIMIGSLQIMQQTHKIVQQVVSDVNCQYINSTDIFILFCYVFIIQHTRYDLDALNILVQRIVSVISENYLQLKDKYPKPVQIILNRIIGQQQQEQQQENLKSKLSMLKNKFQNQNNKQLIDIENSDMTVDQNQFLININKNMKICDVCQLQMEEDKLCYVGYVQLDSFSQIQQLRVFSCQHVFHQVCLSETNKVKKNQRCPLCRQQYNIIIPILQKEINEDIIIQLLNVIQRGKEVRITLDSCMQLIQSIRYSCINNKNQNIQISGLLLNIIKNYIINKYSNSIQYKEYIENSTFIKQLMENNDYILEQKNILTQLLNYSFIQDYQITYQHLLKQYNDIQEQFEDNSESIETIDQLLEQIIILQRENLQNNQQLLLNYQYKDVNIQVQDPIVHHINRYSFVQNRIELYNQIEHGNQDITNTMFCLYCNEQIIMTEELLKQHQSKCNYQEQIFYIPYKNIVMFYDTKEELVYLQNGPYTSKDGYTFFDNLIEQNLYLNQKLLDDLYNFIESQQFNNIQQEYLKTKLEAFYICGIHP